jgi:hypothetical protein
LPPAARLVLRLAEQAVSEPRQPVLPALAPALLMVEGWLAEVSWQEAATLLRRWSRQSFLPASAAPVCRRGWLPLAWLNPN